MNKEEEYCTSCEGEGVPEDTFAFAFATDTIHPQASILRHKVLDYFLWCGTKIDKLKSPVTPRVA